MKQWYKLNVTMARQGAGTVRDTTNYAFAENCMQARGRLARAGGYNRKNIGTITALSEEESAALEERIERERIVPLGRAKRDGYYGIRK